MCIARWHYIHSHWPTVCFFFIEVQLIYKVWQLQIYSKVIQFCIHIHVYILFQILFHYRLLQDIKYSSLCFIVGPCCLGVVHTVFKNNHLSTWHLPSYSLPCKYHPLNCIAPVNNLVNNLMHVSCHFLQASIIVLRNACLYCIWKVVKALQK